MSSLFMSSNLQWVLVSTLVLGIAAGLIGCLSYWKKQSLMSDALAHAALPGVVLAFLLIGEKRLMVLIFGAAVSALIGALFIQTIRSSTRITEDTAMGIILSVFYGLGIMLLTIANRTAGGNQSGLENFIFGQAASMVRSDMFTMLGLSTVVIFLIYLFFKEWKLYLFDPSFAQGSGLSIKGMNALYMLLLVTVIVIGIQAVGVILIAALLIIPPVSARYWTKTLHWMLLLSAGFGGIAGAGGTLISSMGSSWPTGPFIVLAAASIFVFSLLFGKEKGILIKYVQFKYFQKQMGYKPHLPSKGVN
ncbi:metal ABC transporter permease [Virgibacillus sp. YIM 98842]|uniref:metal ABC transporter permease n=1 Tax=Virgibacillus sp. YIM 98842 TaxID=2663533 RepID=UPI0013DB09E9|nr:metal ABC transporter permease [Virgibacillus sp. YIM 98842]